MDGKSYARRQLEEDIDAYKDLIVEGMEALETRATKATPDQTITMIGLAIISSGLLALTEAIQALTAKLDEMDK